MQYVMKTGFGKSSDSYGGTPLPPTPVLVRAVVPLLQGFWL